MTWTEVADGIFAKRHTELDLTTGLIVGDEGCVVVDTAGDHVQGAELAAAIREITAKPWQVVLTHAHFDHYYGTSAFLPCEVWAHENFRIDPEERLVWARKYRADGKSGIAAAIEETQLVVPSRTFDDRAIIDIGRTVALHHFGRAHSFSDVVVHVPDAGVVFAGDLVEEPAFIDESFGDGDVTQWPAALNALLALGPRVVVPGHGAPVDRDFVAAQRDQLIAGSTSAP